MKSAAIKFGMSMLLACVISVHGQTTAINYQGKLTDTGNPANGSFQMQFKLFDSLGGAGQVGTTITDVPVTVTQGVFSVKLDFGSNALSGANRWIEIAIRHNAGEGYTTLNPREQIASSPYAVRTLSAASADNALQLGGVNASEYLTNTSLGNTIIRNQSTVQSPANFNISGNGYIGGSLGIGTSTTQSKLSVFAPMNDYGLTHTDGTVTLGTYIGSGTGWFGTRSNHPLYFFTNDGGPQMVLNQPGNVGIGSFPSQTRLFLSGGPLWTSNGWMGSLGLLNGAAIGWAANTGGQRFGIGQSNGGLFFFRTGSDFGTTATPANYDLIINDAGNVGIGTTATNHKLFVDGGIGQSPSSHGLPKFMMLVRNNGNSAPTIEKCYNTVSATAAVPCGIISMSQPGGAGPISIRFPFRVTDRFFSMTLVNASPVSYSYSVTGFDSGDLSGQTVYVITQNEQDFYLIIF